MNIKSREKLLAGVAALSFLGISPQQTFAAQITTSQAVQQAKKITGNVTDAMGPIIGATVKVKGTKNAVVTDMDGNYTLNVAAGQTVEVSYVGYIAKSFKVGGQNKYNITLTEDNNSLQEVVVVGYGTMKKSDLAGASASMDEKTLKQGADAAVFTHVSNVFGYILPVEQLAEMCRKWRVPFIIDAAQSAGALPVDLQALGADFIAMPGHKGLLGPQGTGLLLCGGDAQPLLFGGTGSDSVNQAMPDYLPDRLEAGTLNVPGYAGLTEGLRFVRRTGVENIFRREHRQLERCAEGLQKLGMEVFAGAHQASTVSFRPGMDCEEAAAFLAKQGIAVRAGLHCAPFAHESAGTLESGTVRVSFGHDASNAQTDAFLRTVSKLPRV